MFSSQIDNISIQELGWADSQELFDGLIAQGKTEQEALEASAMWRYYNNDPVIGATYGKLYNWFAVKLLQNDIDTYNTANPGNEWGWHIPTQAELLTLNAYLGGQTVSAGKLKMDGTWWYGVAGNNESGFSALNTGYYNESTQEVPDRFMIHSITESSLTTNYQFYIHAEDNEFRINLNRNKSRGGSIRLIKD